MSEKTKKTIGGLLIIALFLISSYYVRNNIDFVESLVSNDILGVLVFITFIVFGMIVAPISSLPLIPIASNLWGVGITAAILIFGWTLGSGIIFYMSRRFGAPIVKKFFSLKKIKEIEDKITKENLLFDLVLLRIIIPVDVLSYALGLLSRIPLKTFLLASFIGAIPLAIMFSYIGTISLVYQFIGFFILGLIIIFLQEYKKKNEK